jgi:hypothetical protein
MRHHHEILKGRLQICLLRPKKFQCRGSPEQFWMLSEASVPQESHIECSLAPFFIVDLPSLVVPAICSPPSGNIPIDQWGPSIGQWRDIARRRGTHPLEGLRQVFAEKLSYGLLLQYNSHAGQARQYPPIQQGSFCS